MDDTGRVTRRTVLATAAVVATATPSTARPREPHTFKFALNTSTVRDDGKPRPVVELIDIAAKAGYDGIEPWVGELDAYTAGGGTLKELGKRIADAGLAVPDVIGFAEWIVGDEQRRKKGMEQAKRDMDKVQQIGGSKLAAPPIGAHAGDNNPAVTNLVQAADRYRDLFDLGKTMGVTPVAEVWGFSKTMSRLGEAVLVASEGGRVGCVLPDVYHLYKGGSGFAGLGLLGPAGIGIVHVNDYPAIDRAKIADADRVYPGDGVAPLGEVLATLGKIGYTGFLSLELFNKSYWKKPGLEVASTGLAKLRAVAQKQ
jgi:2-keto-myo-inositol isomerase